MIPLFMGISSVNSTSSVYTTGEVVVSNVGDILSVYSEGGEAYVMWGDGTSETIGFFGSTHAYSAVGTYKITILRQGAHLINISNSILKKIFTIENGLSRLILSNSGIIQVPTSIPSSITSTSGMFSSCPDFNQDISSWDMTNVTDTSSMFENATAFNQPLNTWNMSNVTDIRNMFKGAVSFDQPLNSWDTSSVTEMAGVFAEAEIFNQPLSNWNTSGVTSLSNVFDHAYLFNQDVNSWDVSNVTAMTETFWAAYAFNKPLDEWDVSSVTNMGSMFEGAYAFNQVISDWDVSNVTSMVAMFNQATVFNQDLSSWCVSGIGSEPSSFSGSTPAWTLPKPVWGTCPTVTDFTKGEVVSTGTQVLRITPSGTYGDIWVDWGDGNTQTITGMTEHTYTTAGVYQFKIDREVAPTNKLVFVDIRGNGLVAITNIQSGLQKISFQDAANLTRFRAQLPSSITNLTQCFYNCTSFNAPLNYLDVSNVTDFSFMFFQADIFNQPLDQWDVSSVGGIFQMQSMFRNTDAFNQDLSGWCVSAIGSEPPEFSQNATAWVLPKPVWGTCPA